MDDAKDVFEKRIEALLTALRWYADRGNYDPRADAHGHRQRPIMVYKWKMAEDAIRVWNGGRNG